MVRANIVLAILAVILAFPTAWTLFEDRTIFTEYEDIPRLFPGFTRENVRAVVLSRPKRDENGELVRDEKGEVAREQLQLVRVDDDWRIAGQNPLAGVTVSGAQVYERILQHVESIRRDEEALVREGATPEELERYGLTADEALLIQCYDQNSPLAELYVGADASRGQAGEDVVHGFFVRSKDDNDVVLYEQSYWVLDVDPAQWYDRNPLRFPIDEVVEVKMHNLKGEVTFARENPQAPDWETMQGPGDVGAVRNGEIRVFAQSLSMVNIQEYVERLPAAGPQREAALARHGLKEPDFWAEVKLADGTRHRIAVGAQVPGKNERYLSISSVDFLMTVGEWFVARFEKDPKVAFFDPPATRIVDDGKKDEEPKDK